MTLSELKARLISQFAVADDLDDDDYLILAEEYGIQVDEA